MLKKHMAACLLATVFAAPAFAQTSTAPATGTDRPAATSTDSTTSGSPAMKPGATNPSSNSSMNSSSAMDSSKSTTTMAQSGDMKGQFLTTLKPGQVLASDLIGTKVIGSNNESIGDINDVIVDGQGQAVAAVVGVGGFLGIGEKDVAIPYDQLEFATREQVNAMNDNKTVATGSTAVNNGTAATTATRPATTANGNAVNATGSTATTAGTSASAADNEPERVVLRMTKEELKAAPKFDKDGDNTATGTAAPMKK